MLLLSNITTTAHLTSLRSVSSTWRGKLCWQLRDIVQSGFTAKLLHRDRWVYFPPYPFSTNTTHRLHGNAMRCAAMRCDAEQWNFCITAFQYHQPFASSCVNSGSTAQQHVSQSSSHGNKIICAATGPNFLSRASA